MIALLRWFDVAPSCLPGAKVLYFADITDARFQFSCLIQCFSNACDIQFYKFLSY